MAETKPAKKTEAPPAQPTTATGDRNRAPHERFWEAGQALYQSL